MNKKKFVFSVFLAILLTSLWSASGRLDVSDATIRARVAHQLVTEGKLVVDSTNDPKHPSTFRDANGSYYSPYGLGQSIFFLPFDAIANLVTQSLPVAPEKKPKIHYFLLSVPVFWVVLSLNFWLCLKLSAKLGTDWLNAYLISFVATFGSSFWQMAKQGQEEVQLSILLLYSLYGFLSWRQYQANKYVWLSAASAATTLVFRPTALPLLIGIAVIYVYEIYLQQRNSKLNIFIYLQIIFPFATTYSLALFIVSRYNLFKTGNLLNPGYTILSKWFRADWLNGVIQPVFGLDKGIIWTNLWLLPSLILTYFAWKYLKHELKVLLILSLYLFCASVATYAKCCWAGDFTYGSRYQVHLVPLLCLSLGTATVIFIKTKFYNNSYKKRYKLASLFLGLFLFILQIPSIAFIHYLEIGQAIISNTAAKNGSLTGRLGQVRLRYANFISKLATGKTVKLEVFNLSKLPLDTWETISTWNFWPWVAQKNLNLSVATLLKVLWVLIVLASLISWGYACWIGFYG